MDAEATINQKKLFRLLANFSVEVVTGIVALAYSKTGSGVASPEVLSGVIIPFMESYFNQCARLIYSREDTYINAKFDEMAGIELAGANDPIDDLNAVVMLSLNLVNTMDIKDVITAQPATSLAAVEAHLRALVKRHEPLARSLHGCTNHDHKPIEKDENVFSFTMTQHAQTTKGDVKLSHLAV